MKGKFLYINLYENYTKFRPFLSESLDKNSYQIRRKM